MARKANIHSTPGMFQNWSVPLTRLLNPLTPDSVLPESRRAGTSLSSGTHRTACVPYAFQNIPGSVAIPVADAQDYRMLPEVPSSGIPP